ncbi:hypothetical protein G9F73_019530 [Clostridium estertheticum]|uniref:hypothetical protein n=1 Tax=Clostridium estertheticum TaxID=238834 RepID=UPI0013EEC721|nr:hypothetical protein [Clostridium estertheticum]MBZ9609920.1 hypothetical protein [Clostridium estertheticum]
MLQYVLKKELPTVEHKVALAIEYTQKGLKISRACMLLQISRSAFYTRKKTIKNSGDADVNSRVGTKYHFCVRYHNRKYMYLIL